MAFERREPGLEDKGFSTVVVVQGLQLDLAGEIG